VRLQLSVLAYNLGNCGGGWCARYHWLLLAESHLTRRLFGAMLRRIWGVCRFRQADT
jgi:hypothetical protein